MWWGGWAGVAGLSNAEPSVRNFALSKHFMSVIPLG